MPKQFETPPMFYVNGGSLTRCAFIAVTCVCGNEYSIPYSDNWELNIVAIQLRCKKCGDIISIPEEWYANHSPDKS